MIIYIRLTWGNIMEFKKENIKMQNIENEVNNIFSILTKENNLTLEDLDKLFSKNVELKNKYLIQMKSRAEDLYFNFSESENKVRNNSILAFLLVLVNLGMVIFNPGAFLLSAITLYLLLKKISRSNKKINSKKDEINETCEILEMKLDSFLITIENNETFIFKLQKQLNAKKMQELAADKAWQEKINKANALIEKFMEDGVYPTEIDSQIEQLAIKMLQLDLNVNYKKLEVLLLYAKLKRMGQLDLDAPSVVLTLTKDN